MLVVFKLGGSIAFPGKPDAEYIVKFAEKVKGLGCRLAIVVGAGAISRDYVNELRKHSMNEAFLDEVGIEIARLNARVVAKFVSGKYVETLEHARETVEEGLIPVMGGLIPGQSTDAAAAVLAEYLEADQLVVLTDVDGIYDKDPKKHRDAKIVKKLSFDELKKICEHLEYRASDYPVFDFVAAKIVSRSRIRTVVCNGRKLELDRAVHGKAGTVIS